MLVVVLVVLVVGQRQGVAVVVVVVPGAGVVVVVLPHVSTAKSHLAPSQVHLQLPVQRSAPIKKPGRAVVLVESPSGGSQTQAVPDLATRRYRSLGGMLAGTANSLKL